MFGLSRRLGVGLWRASDSKRSQLGWQAVAVRRSAPRDPSADRRPRASISISSVPGPGALSGAGMLWSQGGWFCQQMGQFASVHFGPCRLNSQSKEFCLMIKKRCHFVTPNSSPSQALWSNLVDPRLPVIEADSTGQRIPFYHCTFWCGENGYTFGVRPA